MTQPPHPAGPNKLRFPQKNASPSDSLIINTRSRQYVCVRRCFLSFRAFPATRNTSGSIFSSLVTMIRTKLIKHQRYPTCTVHASFGTPMPNLRKRGAPNVCSLGSPQSPFQTSFHLPRFRRQNQSAAQGCAPPPRPQWRSQVRHHRFDQYGGLRSLFRFSPLF